MCGVACCIFHLFEMWPQHVFYIQLCSRLVLQMKATCTSCCLVFITVNTVKLSHNFKLNFSYNYVKIKKKQVQTEPNVNVINVTDFFLSRKLLLRFFLRSKSFFIVFVIFPISTFVIENTLTTRTNHSSQLNAK